MASNTRFKSLKWSAFLLSVSLLTACIDPPPDDPGDICSIFRDNRSWYLAANRTSEKWDVPVTTLAAFMYRESKFIADARPPRRRYLGVIPGRRLSTAYGYAQAIDGTWDEYLRVTGVTGAKRDRFADAIEFIAWYIDQSRHRLDLKTSAVVNHYLAYHEGHQGYRNQSWKKKPWLSKAAREVERISELYKHQLSSCQSELTR